MALEVQALACDRHKHVAGLLQALAWDRHKHVAGLL